MSNIQNNSFEFIIAHFKSYNNNNMLKLQDEVMS